MGDAWIPFVLAVFGFAPAATSIFFGEIERGSFRSDWIMGSFMIGLFGLGWFVSVAYRR